MVRLNNFERVMGARDYFKNWISSRRVMGKVISILCAVTSIVMFSCNEKEKEKTLLSIAVTEQPSKIYYYVGDVFDPADMVVTAVFSDGSEDVITVTDDMFDYEFATAGENKTVTISYTHKTVTKTVVIEGITVNEIPVVTIIAQPAAITNVFAGYITGSIVVEASVIEGETLNYQWYSNIIHSNTGGNAINDENSASLVIPASLTEGTYYYFCEIGASGGATSIRSEVAIVRVVFFTGSGTNAEPYLIGTAKELAELAQLVNANVAPHANLFAQNTGIYYQLTADIDLNVLPDGHWMPIGAGAYFKGNFDGNFHKVSGLFIDNRALKQRGIGLFGNIQYGNVRNLGVVDVNILSRAWEVGAVAGYVWGGSITNCYSTGSIDNSESQRTGGVVGYIAHCYVTNCYSTAQVIGESQVGGVVGLVEYESNVTNCYSTGSTIATISNIADAGFLIGGVVGNGGSVTNCYSTSIVAGHWGIGGVAGKGSVTNCAALNSVISRRLVSTNTLFGRVMGVPGAYGVTLTNNVAWDEMKPLNGITFDTGAADNKDGEDISKDAAKLQATYENQLGWKFGNNDDEPWQMGIGDYMLPVFYWQTAAPAEMPVHLK